MIALPWQSIRFSLFKIASSEQIFFCKQQKRRHIVAYNQFLIFQKSYNQILVFVYFESKKNILIISFIKCKDTTFFQYERKIILLATRHQAWQSVVHCLLPYLKSGRCLLCKSHFLLRLPMLNQRLL